MERVVAGDSLSFAVLSSPSLPSALVVVADLGRVALEVAVVVVGGGGALADSLALVVWGTRAAAARRPRGGAAAGGRDARDAAWL